jgi:methionyl aminopeptidase
VKIWREGKLRIGIKDKEDIKAMRECGKILGMILHEVGKMAKEGVTTLELDQHAEKMMKEMNVLPSFKGYHGYPNVICANVNEQVVHGIPTNYKLKDGDIVTIDCGVIHKKFHTDSAITVGVGTISEDAQRLMDTAEKALKKAIETARPGIRVHEISGVIQDIVEKQGFGVVRDLVGHGIGYEMHEDPQVPNFRDKDKGPILQAGMTIAIEPIITMKKPDVKLLKDGWTFVTKDGSLSVQVEHTIVITEKGAETLTTRPV